MRPKLVLDTNAYSAFIGGNVKLLKILQQAGALFLPFIVMAELEYGFMKGNKYELNRQKLDQFLALPHCDVLMPTDSSFEIVAKVRLESDRQGRPMLLHDLWIAAMCIEYGYKLVTNDNDFKHLKQLSVTGF